MAKAEYRSAVRSRRLIRMALADLLQEKPLDKITVTDIVRRADINRGTFYAHYADIPALVNSLVEETLQTLREALRSVGAVTPVAVMQHLQRMLESDLDFYRKVLNSSIAGPIMEQMRSLYIEYMLENEDRFAFQSHESFLFAVSFGAGGVITLYRDWFAGKLPFTLDELTTRAAAVLETMLQ